MDRYHRQIILPGFGTQGQQRLSEASVLLVGVGGLGSIIALYLSGAGIGCMGIVDHDVVSLSNLHRQLLYRENQLGEMKVDRAQDTLMQINRDLVIDRYPVKLLEENAIEIISAYDVVVDGTDNFSSRYLINDVCVGLNKPYFYGSISEFSGQVSLFNSGENSSTYRCLYPDINEEESIKKIMGVVGSVAGTVASIQTTEIIKWIVGCGEPLADKLLTIDLLRHHFLTLQVTPTQQGREASLVRFNELLAKRSHR